MKLQRAKPALLWLWRVAVVALVNVLVYLMLAAPGKKPGAPFYTVMVNPRPQPYRRRGQSPFSG